MFGVVDQPWVGSRQTGQGCRAVARGPAPRSRELGKWSWLAGLTAPAVDVIKYADNTVDRSGSARARQRKGRCTRTLQEVEERSRWRWSPRRLGVHRNQDRFIPSERGPGHSAGPPFSCSLLGVELDQVRGTPIRRLTAVATAVRESIDVSEEENTTGDADASSAVWERTGRAVLATLNEAGGVGGAVGQP